MSERIRVLQVEDDPNDAELVIGELRRAGFEVEARRVDSGPALADALAEGGWDVVLSDYQVPGFGALAAHAAVRAVSPEVPFIVVTGTLDEETAVECLKTGIDDYVLKENLKRLAPAIRQALQIAEERRRSKLLEEEVRQAQKMEVVGRLAGGIAHDFNNLLTVIFANAARLRRALRPDEPALADLEAIEEAARQAKAVTDSLLTLCRRSVTHRRPVEIGALLRAAADLLDRVLPSSVTVELDVPERPLWAFVDPTQMHQVLMNLAINARDAMPGGGTLRFRARPEPRDEGPPAVVLTVQDTGHGMDAATAARAFEPFFTTKPTGQGTGLGLAVAQSIVTEHEGTIDLDTAPGRGATFTITLPGAEPPKEAGTTEPPVGGVAVVAEHNDLIRGLLVAALQDMGFQTEVTPESASDGIRPSLLVLDEEQAVPAASRPNRLPQVPTVVLSSAERPAAPPTGAKVVVLRKPFRMDEFRQAVLEAVRSEGDSGCGSS